jgi:hypothetical protein
MSLIEINWQPDRKQLRGFGFASLIATTAISLLLYFLRDLPIYWAAAIFVVGFIIFLSSRLYLRLTKVFYLALTAVTSPIGFVISFLLMAVFFFLLITPLSLIFRLIGRDSLNRKFDPDTSSYWETHCQPDSLDRYFHQF